MDSQITTQENITKMASENDATTKFSDDHEVNVAVLRKPPIEAEQSAVYQSIRDFMAKPMLVNSTDWLDSMVAGQVLFPGFSIGSTLTGNARWMNKLEGFQLFRGTAVIKVQVNGTPFQQGKLIVHFLPCVNLFDNPTQGAYYTSMHNGQTTIPNLACITQQPHVEYDISYSGDEIRIPYVTPFHWFDRKNDADTDWGTVYVRVLSPLLSGISGQAADVAVFMHFEDVEMSAPRVPQMMTKVPRRKIKRNSEAREQTDSILRGINRAERVALSMGMPSVQVASAAWVARFAARLASAFGYSKTSLNTQPVPVVDQFNRYAATSEGPDSAISLALLHDNALSHKDLVPSGCNQMSMDYLLRVPALYTTFTWDTLQAEDTLLYGTIVRPDAFYETHNRTVGTATVTYRSGPPIFYFNHAFLHWRGSVEFTFKFVKNDYYSGRVAITFTPSNNAVVPTLATGQYALRTIVDLRETDTVVMTVPWLIAKDWLDTEYTNAAGTLPINENCSGQLRINILNRLKAPQTCAGLINVLVYARGGPDFEFARPIIREARSSEGVSYPDACRLPFNPQAGDLVESIGDYPETANSDHYAEDCMGEKVLSVKQILNRFQRSSYSGSANVSVNPAIARYAYCANNVGTSTTVGVFTPWHNLVMPLFAFYRGSSRVCVVSTNSVLYDNALEQSDVRPEQTFSITTPLATNESNTTSVGTLIDTPRNVSIMKVPYQSNYRFLPTNAVATPNVAVGTPVVNSTSVRFSTFGTAATGQVFLKSFCDDFELLYFVGCPPLAYSLTAPI